MSAVSGSIHMALRNWQGWCLAFVALFVLAACGGGKSVSQAPQSDQTMSIRLAQSGLVSGDSRASKETVNLIDLGKPWQNWDGSSSEVYYDWNAGQLRLPAAGWQDVAIGVQRVDQPLTQGVQYRMDVQASDNGAGATLFLFDWNGNLIPTGALTFAKNGAPLWFTAPANVAGFYVQVQSDWNAGASSTLNAQLVDGGNDSNSNQSSNGDELIKLEGDWSDWDGQSQGVFYDSSKGRLVIPPAYSASSKRGVRRYQTALSAGVEHELSISAATDPAANVALFLVDANGQTISFSDSNASSGQWISVSGSEKKRFWPPAGVAGYVVQVQSGYQSQNWADIRPSLKAGGDVIIGGGSVGGASAAGGNADGSNSGGDSAGSGSANTGASSSANGRPRVVIVTDANNSGGDPDDKQSLAHVLWYANELDIRGIVPQLWNGPGYSVAMESVSAYESDFWSYGLGEKGYPLPQTIRDRVAYSKSAGIDTIIREADASNEPLYVLLWGDMTPLRDALYQRPDIVWKLRVLSIASDRMNDQGNCTRRNWNGGGRNDIFNDSRFNNLWWVESNWTYYGMFTGDRPRQVLDQMTSYGALGAYQKQAVSAFSWAQYFRAGDTPTVLYLIDPNNNRDNPTQGSWAGQFTKPFPGKRPNYYTDSAGSVYWDYWNPCNSWGAMQAMFDASKATLEWQRESMYSALFGKLNWIYNR